MQEGQIPHVVCTNAEVKDKNGALFIREFYANLLRGESTQVAFSQGRQAVKFNGHPDESSFLQNKDIHPPFCPYCML